MKIGLVTNNFPPKSPGGGPKSVELLAENLIKRGHEVIVLAFGGRNEGYPDYVEGFDASKRNDFRNIQALRIIKDRLSHVDLIHDYNGDLRPVTALMGKPKITTLNGYMYLYPKVDVPGNSVTPTSKLYRSSYHKLCRHLIKRYDCMTALSGDVEKYHSKAYPGNRIEVVPNMYDPDFPDNHGLDVREKEILYLGRIEKNKGVLKLPEIMGELEEHSLRVVGGGGAMDNLKQKIWSKGVSDRVEVKGRVEYSEISKYYEKASIFVHPAILPEPFGRTVLEAMQMETPVIATNRGGPKDVLREEQLADTVEEIPEKIRQLDRQETIEYQNRRLEDYSPEKVTDMYEKIYRELV